MLTAFVLPSPDEGKSSFPASANVPADTDSGVKPKGPPRPPIRKPRQKRAVVGTAIKLAGIDELRAAVKGSTRREVVRAFVHETGAVFPGYGRVRLDVFLEAIGIKLRQLNRHLRRIPARFLKATVRRGYLYGFSEWGADDRLPQMGRDRERWEAALKSAAYEGSPFVAERSSWWARHRDGHEKVNDIDLIAAQAAQAAEVIHKEASEAPGGSLDATRNGTKVPSEGHEKLNDIDLIPAPLFREIKIQDCKPPPLLGTRGAGVRAEDDGANRTGLEAPAGGEEIFSGPKRSQTAVACDAILIALAGHVPPSSWRRPRDTETADQGGAGVQVAAAPSGDVLGHSERTDPAPENPVPPPSATETDDRHVAGVQVGPAHPERATGPAGAELGPVVVRGGRAAREVLRPRAEPRPVKVRKLPVGEVTLSALRATYHDTLRQLLPGYEETKSPLLKKLDEEALIEIGQRYCRNKTLEWLRRWLRGQAAVFVAEQRRDGYPPRNFKGFLERRRAAA